MPTIAELVERMESVGIRFHPGASDDEIRDAEAVINTTLPEPVRVLYRHGNGQLSIWNLLDENPDLAEELEDADEAGQFWRLLSLTEVVELHPHLEALTFNSPDHVCLWTDDESNFLYLTTGGYLEGRIRRMSHDGRDSSFLYRSVENLLAAQAEAGLYGFNYGDAPNRDYPPTAPWSPERTADERAATAELWGRLNDIPYQRGDEAVDEDSWHKHAQERELYASILCALTPFEDTESLLPLLDDGDFYVQQFACRSLGLRRYVPAVPYLVPVAQRTLPNSPRAAVIALVNIGTPEAKVALETLEPLVTAELRPSVRRAIENWSLPEQP